SDTDFSFSGEAINLNEGLPSELNEDFGFDFNDDVPPPSETDVGVQSSDESFGQESFSQDNFADESFGGDDFAGDSFVDENAPIETFDTSAMEGLDFTVTESENKTEFELGSDDFEIPGFSDTVTAKTDKSGRIKLPTPDFAGAKEGAAPVKNALTDGQYKKFRENLSFYSLNVRIAIESLLVKNEFTDEAQFEVIEKVLNKVAARQLASHLEKMLDISIPVPRDFERRSAAEYEAYKASLQYQLRNRIIPGAILGIVSLALLFGLIVFSRNFIYKPLRANGLYKQGYALIQANEYQQSEMKFIEATSYDLQKKWFFKYARSYREHKQYLRAEKMYKNILNYFNHDKIAGIEYAQMECDELGNYEKAEEIAKREVLDYHINDKDGILLLGDIYLEWATEKEPSKFEEARKQYALLVQLYGDENIYMARMLRYFVRTDNLREVLELKERFYPKGKGFTPDDWTEMSGYLLDKQYGHLSPSDEYLRTSIEDVRDMLNRAVSENPSNPVATYNLSRYFIHMNMSDAAIKSLEKSTVLFKNAPRRRRKDAYKEIDTYRLLGEEYVKQKEFLKAQEAYTGGIVLYEEEKLSSDFEGNEQIGKLYADAGDIDYFIRGNLDSAYDEYTTAVNTHYDTPSIRYRLGYIEYGKEN
ncbi:MAG: hypothetical protein IKI31_07055, partial [Treponema sp.]|nr:hypothetical protein [Treponema sp.]